MSQDENYGRIVGLLDMDCFECQIYQRDNPKTLGKPCVVTNSSTRIVSVNYEARDLGVSRSDSVQEAISKCRQKKKKAYLHVLRIPHVNGKPDSYKLRSASDEVLKVLESQCKKYDNMILQYSPSDEFYIDMTSEIYNNLFAWRNFFQFDYLRKFATFFSRYLAVVAFFCCGFMQYDFEQIYKSMIILFFVSLYSWAWVELREIHIIVRILYGEVLMKRMCNEVYRQTKMTASAGVSTNKFRAKLASSENKPNGVSSIFPHKFESLILSKNCKDVPGLKSGLGEAINSEFGITQMEELKKISEGSLRRTFNDEQVDKIFRILIGFDDSPVIPKVTTNSVSCKKSYYGKEEDKKHSNIFRKTLWRTLLKILIQILKWGFKWIKRIFKSEKSLRQEKIFRDLKNLSKDIIRRLEEERQRHSRETSSITFEIKFYRNIHAYQPHEESLRKTLNFTWNLKPTEIFETSKTFLLTSSSSSLPLMEMTSSMKVTEIGFTARNFQPCNKKVTNTKSRTRRFIKFLFS